MKRAATLTRLLILLALLPAPAMAIDLEDIMGEWAVDAESCRDARLTFTIDQMHEALVAEGGRWVSLAAAAFDIEGDIIVIHTSADGTTPEQRLRVVAAERDRLVLRTDDAARAELAGTDTLTLVRCPAF